MAESYFRNDKYDLYDIRSQYDITYACVVCTHHRARLSENNWTNETYNGRAFVNVNGTNTVFDRPTKKRDYLTTPKTGPRVVKKQKK